MAHKFINEIQAGMQIDDVYMVSQPVLRSTARGDLYIAMFVSDKTGRLNGRMWQASEDVYNMIPKEGFIHIKGRSEAYQGALQMVVDRVRPVDDDSVRLDDYLPRTKKNIRQMYEDVTAIMASIKDSSVKQVVDAFLDDKELMKKFCTAPAATRNHHGYLGGLLEHTHNMLNAAKGILPCYPELQVDLVLAGIFLHDMGKTVELSYKMAFEYTDSGQMLGHIVQTVMMVNSKVEAARAGGAEISQKVIESIEHIILSHHGKYEFGSPKLPMTAEAFLVGYLDNIDAKMNQVADTIENEPGDADWTSYVRSLESKLYRRKVVE